MEGGAKLAIAILVLFIAMVAFFFAFHPGGVNNGAISNPVDILKWMFTQFDSTVAGNGSASGGPATGNAGGVGTGKGLPTGIAPGTSHIGVQAGA